MRDAAGRGGDLGPGRLRTIKPSDEDDEPEQTAPGGTCAALSKNLSVRLAVIRLCGARART